MDILHIFQTILTKKKTQSILNWILIKVNSFFFKIELSAISRCMRDHIYDHDCCISLLSAERENHVRSSLCNATAFVGITGEFTASSEIRMQSILPIRWDSFTRDAFHGTSSRTRSEGNLWYLRRTVGEEGHTPRRLILQLEKLPAKLFAEEFRVYRFLCK